ncbi:hypothetical protein A1QO_01795 [Vibrio genomosp. F10 str. ZF-129]|uniref:DNA-binding protein n=1 Tax=Vibrio genomosp. F10 str. ZF-129 TaxID=1187848 RepID=A0A1E5BCS4_9VIBR|nr:hypothetical protein [Vibrio genomosp. F10]OEE32672.1 hypothetical protein A1QO_01795 [Vibrio genomosp. F10 str. ZF-129]
MTVRKIRPKQFIDEFYPDSGLCPRTVVSWIKQGKLLGDRTPTGRFYVCIDVETGNPVDRVNELVRFLEL